jgi:hypothetical protein
VSGTDRPAGARTIDEQVAQVAQVRGRIDRIRPEDVAARVAAGLPTLPA